jgi:hypothetical protein
MSRDKNLIDLIASYQVDKSNKKTDIPRIQDSQWIIDQFVNLIRDKLEAIDDAKDQINFLNHLTNNIYALQDNRIISEVDQNKTDWLSELVTTQNLWRTYFKRYLSWIRNLSRSNYHFTLSSFKS